MATVSLAGSKSNMLSQRSNDFALATMVVGVIVMMALPLPPWALDVLVAINISIGVVLLLMAMFMAGPLAFSTFPSVLLITTLFRISLNVATTRQILLHAHAGDIIDAFGRLVVGGSLIVGLVVFLIITIVQFIVIAKGAERVAEVGARFTLDALPGKQMSIDSDMRAGLLTQAEAVAKRKDLMRESQFFGAMDGAMKFVKGDAIAGIVIVLVNLVGGIAIGTLVMDLGFSAAVQRFSVLSIGDGLVTQIPALFVSIAAGIAITRTDTDGPTNLAGQIGMQIGAQPRALGLAAVVMGLFALVPGFPSITFLSLALVVGLASMWLMRLKKTSAEVLSTVAVPAACRDGETEPMIIGKETPVGRSLSPFRLVFGEELVAEVSAQNFDKALAKERQSLRADYGLPFPGLILISSVKIGTRNFEFRVQDLMASGSEVPAGHLLALTSIPTSSAAAESGNPVGSAGPEVLAPCRWVGQSEAEGLQGMGVELLSPAAVVARVVVRVMQNNPASLLGVQEMRHLLREIEGRSPDLVREALAVLPLPRLTDLCAALVRERVPLTDLSRLLQALVTAGPSSAAEPGMLYETIRLAMARGAVARHLKPGASKLPVLTMDTSSEEKLRSVLVQRVDGPVFGLAPQASLAAQKSLVSAFDSAAAATCDVLLLPADLRRAASTCFAGVLPRVSFLSRSELLICAIQPEIISAVALPALN
jgi:type III secretion protein V